MWTNPKKKVEVARGNQRRKRGAAGGRREKGQEEANKTAAMMAKKAESKEGRDAEDQREDVGREVGELGEEAAEGIGSEAQAALQAKFQPEV